MNTTICLFKSKDIHKNLELDYDLSKLECMLNYLHECDDDNDLKMEILLPIEKNENSENVYDFGIMNIILALYKNDKLIHNVKIRPYIYEMFETINIVFTPYFISSDDFIRKSRCYYNDIITKGLVVNTKAYFRIDNNGGLQTAMSEIRLLDLCDI